MLDVVSSLAIKEGGNIKGDQWRLLWAWTDTGECSICGFEYASH